MIGLPSILSYVPPCVELLGLTTPRFQTRLTPLLHSNCLRRCSHLYSFWKQWNASANRIPSWIRSI